MNFIKFNIKISFAILFLFSCDVEPEFDPTIYQNLPDAQWYLTEYSQDEELLYGFTYLGNTLLTQTLFGPNGDIPFTLEYDDLGVPIKMHAEVIERVYDVYYFYEEERLIRIEFQVDQDELVRFLFFYDDFNNISTMIEKYRSGFINEVTYQWKDGNIVLYQVHNESTSNELDWVFEFEYDNKRNPFVTVYKDIGYDFFQNIPITANNWTKKTVYRKDNPKLTKVYNSNIEYWGPNYPLFTTTEFIDEDGQVYTSKVDFSY